MVKRALTLLTSILFALPLLMPFNIYANTEKQIIPTWSQPAQKTKWANKFGVTNFCESSNKPQNYSCQLTITVNGDYYGYVYFDGYINNQLIFDYQTMFISGGIGTFYYTWYQNGLQEINKVNIAGLSLVSPTDDIDLTQIIQLLTSINSYEQGSHGLLDVIDDNTLNTVNEIKNVLAQLVVSNGYLETLTKIRQWNFPIESINFVYFLLSRNYATSSLYNYDYYTYPEFDLKSGDMLYASAVDGSVENYRTVHFIIGINKNIYNVTELEKYIQHDNGILTGFNSITSSGFGSFRIIEFRVDYTGYSGNAYVYLKQDANIVPFYVNRKIEEDRGYISTDFALRFGLKNKLLNDLDIIANGTAQSSSAARSNDIANEQLQTDSNTLFTQEDSFKSNMNNAMQNVNNTFRLQDMGTKFVNSAQWVRTQYENLTNNTPFASLITFSLITGLALILLGKVYK